MTIETIKSTGGHSSYYDIPLTEEQIHMADSSAKLYIEDVVGSAFGGDRNFTPMIMEVLHVSYLMDLHRGKYRPVYMVLSPEQQKRAVAEGKIKIDDLILSLLGNDFDLGTILKSLKRAYEAAKGRGKEGADVKYNLNKVKYSIEQVDKRSDGADYFYDSKIVLKTLIDVFE